MGSVKTCNHFWQIFEAQTCLEPCELAWNLARVNRCSILSNWSGQPYASKFQLSLLFWAWAWTDTWYRNGPAHSLIHDSQKHLRSRWKWGFLFEHLSGLKYYHLRLLYFLLKESDIFLKGSGWSQTFSNFTERLGWGCKSRNFLPPALSPLDSRKFHILRGNLFAWL